MRITNSMMINNVLTDLNSGLIRQNKYFQQLASNRKMVNLSDNPIGLVNSLNARQNLRQISQYRDNITTTRKWTQQAETSVMDLQSIVVKIRENVIDAGGTKNISDKQNIATIIGELKEHLFETLNTAVGDKFLFGGFNTTKKPFTMDKDGNVLYNGINLADIAPKTANAFTPAADVANFELKGAINPPDDYTITKESDNQIRVKNASGSLDKVITLDSANIKQTPIKDDDGNITGYANSLDLEGYGLSLGTMEWETTVQESDDVTTLDKALDTLVSDGDSLNVSCGLYNTMTDIVIDPENELTAQGGVTSIDWEGPITAGDKYYIEAKGAEITIKDSKGVEIVKKEIADGDTELDLTEFGLGTIKWTGGTAEDAAKSIASAGYVTTKLGEEASQDIQFEIGYQIKMNATFTGIDLVGTGEDNMFKILDDLIADLNAGAGDEVLGKYLTKLSDVQNRLLTNVVELGARSTKLDTMENRYSLDYINAEAVRGNIEDIDQAETIMNMKFAEAIYKQALACGAMIIQPTLMDFLN